MSYRVGYFIGSLSSTSINRRLAQALVRLGAEGVEFFEIPIKDLPLYSPDYDAEYPAEGQALKDAVASAQALLFVSPEYNRSIPGALKNAIDWASRPWGENSFDHKPTAIIGASIGAIGTAVAQQSLRAVMAFCNARQMTSPEAYIHFTEGLVDDQGNVTNTDTREFLQAFMTEFDEHTRRVLQVLPPK